MSNKLVHIMPGFPPKQEQFRKWSEIQQTIFGKQEVQWIHLGYSLYMIIGEISGGNGRFNFTMDTLEGDTYQKHETSVLGEAVFVALEWGAAPGDFTGLDDATADTIMALFQLSRAHFSLKKLYAALKWDC